MSRHRAGGLHAVLLNARSIRNKLLEFRAMVATTDYDLIAITETWLDTGNRDFDGEYHLPGYTMFHKDRVGRMGGGVLLYVRDHLNAIGVALDSPHEFVGADVKGCSPPLRVVAVYRPPHSTRDSDESLYSDLSRLIQDRTLVVGDFNCHLDWDLLVAGAVGMRLVDFSNDCFLTQLVRLPTRGQSTLDLVFTTDEDMVINVEVGEALAGSDHSMVSFGVLCDADGEQARFNRRLDLRRANYTRFVDDLLGLRLQLQLQQSAEELWNVFFSKYLEIRARCIPYKRTGGSKKVKPSWFTRELADAIQERKRLYRASLTDPSPHARDLLARQRRLVGRMTRQAKAQEENRVALASKDNPKEFFAYVNKHKVRKTLGPLETSDGLLVTDNYEIAQVFNQYFSTVFTVENAGLPPPIILYDGEEPLEEISIVQGDIYEKLTKLDPHKAPGPDTFLPKVMKNVAAGLAPHLSQVFEYSLETGQVPLDWRSANVCPIHKKGPEDQASNFRPVSLTSVPGKVLESLIKDRIVIHLERNQLLTDSQHGFRAGRSCLTNLLEFYHGMIGAYDRSGSVDVIFLDFQKAFDKVPHRRLMSKVRALGIVGKVADWIEAWLSNRRQRVVIGGTPSGWLPVTSGVPQGSVLGPLLFLIYINDIDAGIISRMSKFADDTKLGANAADPESVETLRRDLARIGEWSERWQMPFNTGKCKTLHVGGQNLRNEYHLQGSLISPSERELDLGVVMTSEFKFGAQCIAAERKAQKVLGYIKRVFIHRNRQTVMTLYKSLVRPHLEYAVQFWSPTYRCDVDRLERIQARVTKLVPEIRNKGYARRLQDLDLHTLEQRRLRGQLIETYKIIRGYSTLDPTKIFSFNVNATRNHGYKLEVPRFRTNKFRDFMTVKICAVWNALPAQVVNAPSVESFKRHLDRIIRQLA